MHFTLLTGLAWQIPVDEYSFSDDTKHGGESLKYNHTRGCTVEVSTLHHSQVSQSDSDDIGFGAIFAENLS